MNPDTAALVGLVMGFLGTGVGAILTPIISQWIQAKSLSRQMNMQEKQTDTSVAMQISSISQIQNEAYKQHMIECIKKNKELSTMFDLAIDKLDAGCNATQQAEVKALLRKTRLELGL